MRIRLDGRELSLDQDVIDEGKEAVFNAVREEALEKKSVIVNITVDGEPIDDEEVFFSLSGGLDIEFNSQPVMELVNESLSEGNRYFPILISGLESIATLFEENKTTDARNKFVQALEGINWLVKVFDNCCILLSSNPEQMECGNFNEDISALNEALEEIITAMDGGKTMTQAWITREKLLPSVRKLYLYWNELAKELDSPLQ